MHPDTTLDLADLERQLGPRTKVVAFSWASNAAGTIVDARAVSDLAHQAGALAWIDAVQYAPHEPDRRAATGADVLLCSAYKFCGPHLGIACGRREVLESWRPYKVRPARHASPVGHRFETGTLPYELLAGLIAALRYLDDIGGLAASAAWERQLGERLLAGLPPTARLYGAARHGRPGAHLPAELPRHPSADAVRRGLAERGFGVWSGGNYYAPGLHERIGWGEALRVGLAHYNTLAEVDRFNEALAELVGEPRDERRDHPGHRRHPGRNSWRSGARSPASCSTSPGRAGGRLVRRLVDVPAGRGLRRGRPGPAASCGS